jgi:hypothetical protein
MHVVYKRIIVLMSYLKWKYVSVCYCRFHITFQSAVPKFVVNLPITFPNSEVGRELRNEVRKFFSKFEFISFINLFKKAFSSWETTGPIFYCSNMCIGPYTVISTPTMNICLQSKFELWNELANFVAKFTPNFRTWQRDWQVRNEPGNSAVLKVTWNRQ